MLRVDASPRGALMIIGGAEDRRQSCRILKEFVRLAGGADARIVVVTAASEIPEEVGADYRTVLERLIGQDASERIEVLHVRTRADANRSTSARLIQSATGVFFTGGDQMRSASLIGGTRLDGALHEHCESGLVLAGTSAGAAMMSGTMIVSGLSDTSPRLGTVELGPGMEFLPGVMIDQHFTQRGRIGRLLSAIAQYPHMIGIGIDEDTALVVEGHVFTVLGEGSVMVVDGGRVTANNLMSLEHHGELIALCGVKLHVLPEGYQFDLLARRPVVPASLSHALATETPHENHPH